MEEFPQRTQTLSHRRRLNIKKILAWTAGVLLMLSMLIVLFTFVSIKVFRHLYEKAPDPIVSYQIEKRVEAEMFSWVTAEVAKDQMLSVRLSKILEADIPFKQDVDIWVDNDFTVPIDTTFSIPIDQEIHVEAEVPIETQIPLDGIRVQTSLWGLKNISIPLYGDFPVKMIIPFNNPIRVKTEVQVHVQKEVTVHVKKKLTFPLDLKPHVRLPIDDIFTVSLPEDLKLKTRVAETIPVNVRLNLDLPKEGLPLLDAIKPAVRKRLVSGDEKDLH
ncbi:MAG: hypothetical protein SWH68_15385 [Thermodesulfobacteriota bacterium]|nr:hypothetical protein [Thermodesulfobacteriota bacterium]